MIFNVQVYLIAEGKKDIAPEISDDFNRYKITARICLPYDNRFMLLCYEIFVCS